MKKLYTLFAFLFIVTGFSQSTMSDYNMALIPAKFEFQKTDNQYRINTTLKAFLKQKGFEDVYLTTDVLPEGFMDYNCNKLFVNVIEENTLMVTKLKVEFKDCKNTVLFTTDLGESASKDFAQAYNAALLATLKTFSKSNYKYSGKTYYDEEAQAKLKSREVENVSVVKSKKVNGVVTEEASLDQKKELPQVTSQPTTNELKVVKTATGFELFNSNEKMVLVAKNTSKSNLFIAISGKDNGILHQGSDQLWYFEYYNASGKLILENLNIKF